MNTITRISMTLSAVALCAVALGQTSVSKNTGYANKIGMPRTGLSAQDMMFIKDAAAANTFEVESSKLALSKASAKFVKEFAKEMVADHTSAFDELKTTASKRHVMVSTKLPPKLAMTVAKLSGLSGAAFDSAYTMAQKYGHAETAMKMEREIKMGHDSSIKNYAIKTLPAVKMHQKMLATKTTMMGPTKMSHGM